MAYQVPLPMHMQPPPSVSTQELAMLGISFVSPFQLRGMIEGGARDFVVVDLRDDDFFGGHIPGCEHIPSKTFMPTLEAIMSRLQGARTVIFHCLISRHRAPMCAKIYKERLKKLGRSQDVAVLEGGFHKWREHFSGNSRLIEGEALTQPDLQSQLRQGVHLGQEFVANVLGSVPQGNTLNAFPLSPSPSPLRQESIPYSSFPRYDVSMLSGNTLNAFPPSPPPSPLRQESIPYSSFPRYDMPKFPESTLNAFPFSSPPSSFLPEAIAYSSFPRYDIPTLPENSIQRSFSYSPPSPLLQESMPYYDVPTLPAAAAGSFEHANFMGDMPLFSRTEDVVRALSIDRISKM